MRFSNAVAGTCAALAIACAGAADATTTIADIDLASLSFEVDDFATAPGSISGASNGVRFEVQANAIFLPFSNLNGGQTYNELPGGYDDLHLGQDFSITFERPVTSLLFAFANDNSTGDGPDFGLTPDEIVDIDLVGAKLSIQDRFGALALFNFSTPTDVLVHTNDAQLDGFDVSFFVVDAAAAPVPLPAPGLLLGMAALAGLGYSRARRRRFRKI